MAEDQKNQDKPDPDFKPATLGQKVGLTVYLLAWVLVLLPSIRSVINQLNAPSVAEVSIGWEMPAGATLDPGPAAFRYDAMQKRLMHYGVITAERKLELRALLTFIDVTSGAKPTDSQPATKIPAAPATTPSSGPPVAPRLAKPAEAPSETATVVTRVEAGRRAYYEAIDNLAYLANERQGVVISLLLLLGGLGGTLGAILRCLNDFVGNAAYKAKNIGLDLTRWWPLYVTRPVVGAILGFILVALFKGQLLTASDVQSSNDSFWWLGVAVIGGFSTVDVTDRLRAAAKAMFGTSEKK